MLSVGFAPDVKAGIKVSDDDARRAFGADIGRALEIAHYSQQQAAHALAYANQSTISKLVGGVEPSVLSRLMTLPGFKAAYIVALTETCADTVGQYVVTLPKRRRA